MERTKVEIIAECVAADEEGGEHTVYQVTTFHEMVHYGGRRWAEGKKDLYLDDPDPTNANAMLNRVQKGVYETVIGNRRITSDDPNAP